MAGEQHSMQNRDRDGHMDSQIDGALIVQQNKALRAGLKKWQISSSIINLLNEGKVEEAEGSIRLIKDTQEASIALMSLVLYDVHKQEVWRKHAPTFEEYCEKIIHRSSSSVYDLLANVKFWFYNQFSRQEYYEAMISAGWSGCRAIRQHEVPPEKIHYCLQYAEENELAREDFEAWLDDEYPKPGNKQRGKDRVEWKRIGLRLPPDTLQRWQEAIRDIKQTQGLKRENEIIEYLLMRYWQVEGVG